MALTASDKLVLDFTNDVTDRTGNHSPSANGSPTYVQSLGGFNKAISFNGSTQYLTVADSDDWTFTADATIGMLINFGALPANGYIINQVVDGNNRWGLQYTTGGGIDFFFVNASTEYRVSQGSSAGWSIDTWYYLTVVLEDSGSGYTITTYRNGVSIASGSTAAKMNNYAGALTIGGYNSGASNFTNCKIDDLIITHQALYTGAFTPPIRPYGVDAPAYPLPTIIGSNTYLPDNYRIPDSFIVPPNAVDDSTEVYTNTFAGSGSLSAGFTSRILINASDITDLSGTEIKVKFEGNGTTPTSFEKAYIGKASVGGNAWDFDGGQVQLLFSGSSASGSYTTFKTSDLATLSTDGTDDLIISTYTSGGWSYSQNTSGGNHYYKSGDTASDTAPTGYSSGTRDKAIASISIQ